MLLDDKNKEIALIKNIINSMLLLSKQLKLYGAENRLITLTTSRLQHFLEGYFLYRETLSLNVARHGFLFDEEFIERPNQAFAAFAYTLFQHGISGITLQRDITPHDIHTLLSLTGRPASESWEEGGISAALKIRKISTIKIREMAESDIAFIRDGEGTTGAEIETQRSPIWDRFAFAALRGFSARGGSQEAGEEDLSPESLSRLANQLLARMSAENQQKFSKGLSNFLVSLQHEKIPRYRSNALEKLTAFINRVSPEIRQRLFSNILNLKMHPTFAEEFCAGLSDETMIEILELASRDDKYIPPVILKVLGKIARDKKLDDKKIEYLDRKIKTRKTDISKLFQKDAFDKYVPEGYRKTLLNIIQHDTIPPTADKNLLLLKNTLEESLQEQHTADIILKILKESPDPDHLQGLDENLAGIVTLFLESGDYKGLYELWCACQSQQQSHAEVSRLGRRLTSVEFAESVLAGLSIYGRKKQEEIEKLAVAIGLPFIKPLLHKLATESNSSYRMYYLQMLQRLDPKAVSTEAVNHLGDQRWYFLRNVLYILRSLQQPWVLPQIRPLTRHSHPKVRAEALRTCLQYGCEKSVADLLQMLHDKEAKTVDTGISLAIMVKNQAITERLLSLLQEFSLFDYRFEQKKALIQTLTEIAPAEALPALSKVLTSISLTHPKQHDRLKDEVIKALERFNPAELIPLIREIAPKASGDIQLKLQSLLRRMEA